MTRFHWAPTVAEDVTLLPAGRHWDAVRTSLDIARAAFTILDGTENCATIVNPRIGCAYWLLPVGEAHAFEHWGRLAGHVTLTHPASPTYAHYVGVPAAHRRCGPGLHWRITGEWSGRYLAQPYYLGAVLTTAVALAHGPDALPRQCALCERELEPADAVIVRARAHPADPAPRALRAHPACAHAARLRDSPVVGP
ncbi:hypothetical protein AAHZ94_08150 [Streptomyces sp. HSW2009]|uniref:hypothetical protein n=1 Tax=Streptomyces sp. HSW2009 TaxID=3142890 RepID=UPI0032EC9AE2